MPAAASPTADHDALEERIFQRLAAWQQQYPAGDGPRDRKLENDIYLFLYRELKGIAHLLPGFDRRAVNQRIDVACRFTSVLNMAFMRILDKYPDKLMRAKSSYQLAEYVSRTMSSMILNHYQREERFRGIIDRLGRTQPEDELVRDILSHLADEKAEYFQRRTGMLYAEGLRQIQQWDQSENETERSRARVLRLRYVDGLSYDDIGAAMQIDRSQVENLLEQAKYHLRKLQS